MGDTSAPVAADEALQDTEARLTGGVSSPVDSTNGNSSGDSNAPSNSGKQAQSSDHWNSY